MNSTTKNAIEIFLLDYNMFQRTFANDALIYPEEWIEYDTIKDNLLKTQVENERNLCKAQLNVFLEKLIERISMMIPIKIENLSDVKLFLDLTQVIRQYYSVNGVN